jgi:hypothetical protein
MDVADADRDIEVPAEPGDIGTRRFQTRRAAVFVTSAGHRNPAKAEPDGDGRRDREDNSPGHPAEIADDRSTQQRPLANESHFTPVTVRS